MPFSVGGGRKETAYGRIEVIGPDGTALAHHAASVALGPGEPAVVRLRLDDPATDSKPWRIRFTDALTAASAEASLAVQPSAEAAGLAKAGLPAEPEMRSRQFARRGPEVDDSEFIGLLQRLRELHLSDSAVDKRRYGAFAYEMGGSRQDTNRRLAGVDWTTRAAVLADNVATGARLYLVGEDLGFDPVSGVSLTPGRRPRIVEALDGLVATGRAKLNAVAGQPDLRVLTIGKGLIVLDRRSPDAAGNSNLHLTLFQRQWRDEMLAIGLGPEGAAQGLVPAGGESIRAWLLP